MITILLISTEKDTLSDFESGLKQHNQVETLRADSSRKALDMIADNNIDLAVVDENIMGMPGSEFTKKLLSVNPMTNYALISSLSARDFHEASEGLGVLMQLPVKPDKHQAKKLIDSLKKVLSLT